MTRRDDLEAIRSVLERRRRDLSTVQASMSHELDAMQSVERDSEYEETAQVAQAEYTLTSIHDSRRREVEQVDAALRKLEDGTYGLCTDCELEIPTDRLLAVPYALRCADCAAAREALHGGHSPAMY